MFTRYLRAGINIGFAVLLAAILGFVLQFFIPMMGPDDGLLYRTFEALDNWMLFLMIGAVLFGVVVRAVVESDPRRVRR